MVPAPHARLKLMPECRAKLRGRAMSHSEIKQYIVELLVAWAAALFLVPRDDRMARQEVARTTSRPRRRLPRSTVGVLAVAIALFTQAAKADEGGVSFWVPGLFGSLAATPQVPGFSWTNIYYHTSVKAGADVAFARQVSRGRITTNFTANLSGANLDADADLELAIPQYVFATPFLGGQAAVALLVPYGRNTVSVDATLAGALGPFGFTVSGGRTDSVSGFGDLIPMFSVRWNNGVHNWMSYITGDIPVGAYNSTRLANIGIGHGAIDGGGGYTYFNPMTGHEFSAVLGFTYNFENQSTQYQNGVDMHLDWASVAVRDQAVAARPGRLRLQAALVRQRHRRPGRLLQVAGVRRRAADRLRHSARRRFRAT